MLHLTRQVSRWWLDRRLRTKTLVVVGLPVAALLVAASAFLLVQADEAQSADLVAHTQVVKTQIEHVLALLDDAETGVRGYLLTGDRTWLAPYTTAQAALPGALAQLTTLVADNPIERARAGAIRANGGAELRVLAALVAAGPPPAGTVSDTLTAQLASGKTLMDGLRADLAAMTAEEERLLAERTATSSSLRTASGTIVAAGIVLGLGGGLLGAFLLTNGVVRRIRRLGENAEALAEGRPSAPIVPAADEIGELGAVLERTHHLLAERETALREARAFLESLIDTGPVLMFRVRVSDGATTYVSPNVTRLLGYAPEELLHAPGWWNEHLAPDDRNRLAPLALDAAAQGAPEVHAEVRCRNAAGEWRWLEMTARPEYAADGAPVAFVAYALDVTARREAEAERELAKAAAEAANQAKRDFLSRMSHELRTPLNSVIGFAQLLELEELTAAQREHVRYILRGGRHLLDLINEVLDITRIESGQLAISPEPVEVQELVDELLGLIGPLAAARDIVLDARDASCAQYVWADRQRIKQVLINLLSNAVKYNRDGGRVQLSCQVVAERRFRITIADTGPGLSDDQQARLFLPFERLGAERTDTEGTGIGLALSKALMEAMGGTIGVQSSPGEGSQFWVELGLVDGPEAAAAERDALRHATEGALGTRAGQKIVLYVEDNVASLRLVEHILSRRSGIGLLTASLAQVGLHLAHDHRPDLILIDLHLPDLPGFEVLQRLRADPATRGIPVIVLSADATERQIRRLLDAGAHAYLTKPIDVTRFLALVDELLGPHGATSGG